jgi:scavenger receptor class B, member 1
LTPNSKSYSQWKSPNVTLYFDIYLFNCTNSEEFDSDHSVKLKFEQLGPYRFREVRDKDEVKFNEKDSTVAYRPFNTYYFEEELSNGTLDDIITNINIVVAGAASLAEKMEYEQKKFVSLGFHGYDQTLFSSKTARELLFEGYEDNMVTFGRLGKIEGFDPNDIPFDRIGWFYTKNASSSTSGHFTMNTGNDNISKLGTINAFNRHNSHLFYKGQCSEINGFIGEVFPPLESKHSISLFLSDMCRTIPLDYEREDEIHDIPGYRFVAGKRAVDNGSIYSPNLCYSEGSSLHFPSGVMNISACRYSSPIFMSYPHFYDADPYYLESIEGLEPIKEKHQSHFTIEPVSESF